MPFIGLHSFLHPLCVSEHIASMHSCVCSRQASQPRARSQVRWDGRELWEMKPSWTWITFALSAVQLLQRARDDRKGQTEKRFYYFPSLICDYPLTFPLSLSLLGIVSPSHSLLNDINWQEAEFSDGANLFYKEPVIALNIREWIQHLSALKTWIAALEGKHTRTHTRTGAACLHCPVSH